MICKAPYRKDGREFGCGRCMPCRINHRRLWVSRIMLEASTHEASSFVTLTYADEYLPENGSLVPRHLQLWQKRVRRSVGSVRFFSIGEYGERTFRPHYHAAVFGLDPFVGESVLPSTWSFGFVHVGELNQATAEYIAGYTTKKMTRKDDERLQGRYPEFARPSRNPGIGVPAVARIAEALNSPGGASLLARGRDVPTSVRAGRRSLVLGRTLRNWLRVELGLEPGEQPGAVERYAAEMLALCESKGSVKAAVEGKEVERQVRALQAETKFKIFDKRRTL